MLKASEVYRYHWYEAGGQVYEMKSLNVVLTKAEKKNCESMDLVLALPSFLDLVLPCREG